MNKKVKADGTADTLKEDARKIADENAATETFDDIPDEEGDEIEEEKEIIDNQMERLNELNRRLDEARAEVEKEKKEYLYLMAEFDNFRKRSVKEKSDIIKNATESAMKELLPVVDDFERAIEASASSDDAASIKEGTKLIYNKLVKYLERQGVKPIDSTGSEFDADVHEAVAMVPGDPDAKGRVIDTLTKGYKLGDKVIRHAKVAVGQ